MAERRFGARILGRRFSLIPTTRGIDHIPKESLSSLKDRVSVSRLLSVDQQTCGSCARLQLAEG